MTELIIAASWALVSIVLITIAYWSEKQGIEKDNEYMIECISSARKKRDHHESIIVAQISMLNTRAAEIKNLKRKISARKGQDTKRANRLGCCVVVDFPVFGEYYATDGSGELCGKTCKTKSSARRSFESMVGLKGLIKWEKEKK